MLKAIIFDFDGVIVESVDVKIQAFRRIFEELCPEHLDAILDYHKINGGISRYVKFQYIYDHFIKKPLSPSESQRLGVLFSQYALEGVLQAPFVLGADRFLQKYQGKFSFFIVSGTPEDEMILIARKRALDGYFQGIYGSPRSKAELNRMILDQQCMKTDEVIFVGDSVNDLQGAQQAGIRFIGRLKVDEPNPFPKAEVEYVIRDLDDLDAWLRQNAGV